MIYILSGDIRSGKTTALLNWTNTSTTLSGTGRKDIDGLLCPDGDHGKRYFLKINSKEQFELEVESESEDTITIGPFHFLTSAFEKANEFLIELNTKMKSQFLIIDELGKLELKHKGLHDSAIKLIPDFMFNDNRHLILVVRTSLLEDILRHYSISNYTILNNEDLKSLN